MFTFADDLKYLMTRAATMSLRNCDDIFNDGERNDGVYEIFTGFSYTQAFCEFNRENYNWMVNILNFFNS